LDGQALDWALRLGAATAAAAAMSTERRGIRTGVVS
jgi:hypothetical protein